jgi:hypothetical protein
MGLWCAPNLKDLEYERIYEEQQENLKNFSQFTHSIPKKQKYVVKTNRLVPSQPIRYEPFHTNIEARFNLRKLNMLPYHLIKAEMLTGIFPGLYFPFGFYYLTNACLKNFTAWYFSMPNGSMQKYAHSTCSQLSTILICTCKILKSTWLMNP